MRCWLGWLGLCSQDFQPPAGLGPLLPLLPSCTGVGEGWCRLPGALGQHDSAQLDPFTQAEGQVGPLAGPATEGPARELPLFLALALTPNRTQAPSVCWALDEAPRMQPLKSPRHIRLVVQSPGLEFSFSV